MKKWHAPNLPGVRKLSPSSVCTSPCIYTVRSYKEITVKCGEKKCSNAWLC